MAEALAAKILAAVASPAVQKAYEKGLSICEAKDELARLEETIETIKAVLQDAEKKQESSASVKSWIKRLKGVLYDTDDLFDEVATDELLKQQLRKGEYKLPMKEKVRFFCINLNPIVARNSIAEKVKVIRKSLDQISKDMTGFNFCSCGEGEIANVFRGGQDRSDVVEAEDVIGREEDRKDILNMLFDESYDDSLGVIAIVGIGGMGKTTLARMIIHDDEVKGKFQEMWFACISYISNTKEFLIKICQSISKGDYSAFDIDGLKTKIRESVSGKKFLLVLDDVWVEDRAWWHDRMSLLRKCAKGSRIIVTARSSSVATAVGALRTHLLCGLSEEKSWDLFKRIAFAPGYENDPRRIELGREIVKKCRNVPLAIKSIGSLLSGKNSIEEWVSFKGEELPQLGQRHEDGIMPVLKLSYDHLPSNIKQCFAYCSLFPQDYRLIKEELIYLWSAQGYIEKDREDVGHSHFLYLLRRGFFQEVEKDDYGGIKSCKMHDLIHDLAQHLAAEESVMLSTLSNPSNCTKHVSSGDFKIDDSWAIPTSLINAKGLRSFMLLQGSSFNPSLLDRVFKDFRRLRALWLTEIGIENIPISVGELRHLRYLDLSWNKFEGLPDSLTNLLNLYALDIRGCVNLKALPKDLIKLINLRYLNICRCIEVKHMPIGVEGMICFLYWDCFEVAKATISEKKEGASKGSRLIEFAKFQHLLRGEMSIVFEDGMKEEEIWGGDECKWQLPISLNKVSISRYPGLRVANWDANVNINVSGSKSDNLTSLRIEGCKKLKFLPSLRCNPNLRDLTLANLEEIEYMEDEENNESTHTNASNPIFFPRLEKLRLIRLPKLKGWWRKVTSTWSSPASPDFPLLSYMCIRSCQELDLTSFPLCSHLRELELIHVDVGENKVMDLQSPSLVSTFPRAIEVIRCVRCNSLKSVHLESPHLKSVTIISCNRLVSIEMQAEAPSTSLFWLDIVDNKQLKNLHISAEHCNDLTSLKIIGCPELKLWDSPDNHLDWDALTILQWLTLEPFPTPEQIPKSLLQRRALGQLRINRRTT